MSNNNDEPTWLHPEPPPSGPFVAIGWLAFFVLALISPVLVYAGWRVLL